MSETPQCTECAQQRYIAKTWQDQFYASCETQLDHFAGQALIGLLANYDESDFSIIAADAYDAAEAMVAERAARAVKK